MTKLGKAFKYEAIAREITNEIADGKIAVGSQLDSEIELAKKYSVSRVTIRKAIDYLCENGVVYRQKSKGAFVGEQRKKRTPSYKIAVLTSYITDYVFGRILRGIESKAHKEGYTIQIGITEFKYEKEAQFILKSIEQGVDGLIVESTLSALPNPNLHLYQKLDKLHIPYVFINSYYPSLNPVYVVTDDVKVGNQAVKLLAANGHKHISGIFKMDELQGHQRYQGFLQGCRECGITGAQEHTWWYTTDTEKFVFSEAYDDFVRAKLDGCTAIVCYSDYCAGKLMKYFERNHISMPADMSLVGIDNMSSSHLPNNDITTFSHPKERLGAEAIKCLLEMMKTGKKIPSCILPMEVVERDSIRKLDIK